MSNIKDSIITQAFVEYQKKIVHRWSQTLAALGFTLVPLFLILDYFALPEELISRFAIYRGISTLIVIIQYIVLQKTKPSTLSYIHGFLFSFVVGGAIVLMTADLGGFDARYYAGLNLVIIAATLLLPVRIVLSVVNAFVPVALYLIWNIIIGKPYLLSNLIGNLFFMISTVIICVSINRVRFGLIEKEFYSRSQLQEARDSLWTEIELAKRIQTSLLPEKTRIGDYEISGIMIPAEEVGGDYYDIIETRAGEHWIAIGDVSGRGLESGLIMMMAQICFFAMVNITPKHRPSTIIEYLNYILRNNLRRLGSQRYMTIMVMRLDESKITVAGSHQDIIIHRANNGTIEKIPLKGSWVGLKDDIGNYLKDQSISIEIGDLILLFTDGVTEAGGKYGEMFGQERLEKLLYKYAKLPSSVIVQKIAKEVLLFNEEQYDDITLLILRKLE